MKILNKWILVCFTVLIFSHQASAASFDDIFIFGDSLSDSGAYIGNADAAAGGRFTTNPGPVWTETLGAFYGLSVVSNNPNNPANTSATGNNYAQGGAQVTSPIGIGQSASPQNAIPIATQINNYLTSVGGVANPNGLYTVWGGANDIFFNAGLVGGGLAIPSAINNLVTSAMSLAGLAQTLGDAGAGTILVPNLPDIGTSPTAVLQAIGSVGNAVGATGADINNALLTATFLLRTPANSPADQATVVATAIAAAEAALGAAATGALAPTVAQTSGLLSGLTAAYNASLAGFINASTANIILLDIASFFKDTVSVDPSGFGLTNVTGTACNTLSSLTCTSPFFASPTAAQDFLFADSVHPTTAGHAVIAGFAISTVEAAAVPAPAALFLLGPALGILGFRRKRVA
ncbi:MAG: SGNH/GDSL hydrolase family protein [Gammaproteobacteria bacterium]